MYTLNIKNNYPWAITVNGNKIINDQGDSACLKNQGNSYVTIPGIGEMAFIDLGDKKIAGYPFIKETWGVLVRTSTVEAYYRYEGGGELTAVIDQYGTCTLSTSNGTLISIAIPELIIQ